MKVYVFSTYETGGVVVTHSLGVTEGFKYGVSLHDLIFQVTLLGVRVILLAGGTDSGEVGNYLLRVFSLTSSRLSTGGWNW